MFGNRRLNKMNEVTIREISDKIQNHYGSTDRDTFIYKCRDCYTEVGSVYLSVKGSPPKGSAVYLPGHRVVSIYDVHGRRWKNLTNTEIIDLDNFKDVDILLGRETAS